jgi:tetratricopeptide (TPR) repeat protein
MGMTIRPSLLCLPLLAIASLCFGQAAAKSTPAAAGVSRLEVVRMLHAREFDRLDRTFVALQDLVERDIRQEPALARALSAFDTTDPTVTPLVEAWVKARPDSYAALLARAEHSEALAWAARGNDWRNRTSQTQIQAMELHLARTGLDAEAALRIKPRLTFAVAQLVSAAKSVSAKECALRFDRFSDQIGASLAVRLEVAKCFLPRWGGSYRALEALVEEAEKHLVANPRLSALGGMVAWNRGDEVADDDAAAAVRLFTEALGHGDHRQYRLSRARLYFDERRFSDALTDIDAALDLVPEDTEALMLRAWTRDAMGRTAQAAADLRLVAELDPPDEMLADFREAEVEDAVEIARQRNGRDDPEAAILRLNGAVALVGEHPELLYWRGRSKLAFKDYVGALADYGRAVELDPRHFEARRGVDFILVTGGQYLKAIEYWSAYLTLEPGNAKALLARAKAYIGRGDVPPGVADAKAACTAGLQEGCLLAATLPHP